MTAKRKVSNRCPWVEVVPGYRMTEAAARAFDAFYQLGPTRTIARFAREYRDAVGGRSWSEKQIRKWAHTYHWQDAIGVRVQEDMAVEREAALQERARLARKRMANAAKMQATGIAIIDMADLESLSPRGARNLMAQAVRLIEAGIKIERLELGESTENLATVRPPKPISEMTDDELRAWKAELERLRTAT